MPRIAIALVALVALTLALTPAMAGKIASKTMVDDDMTALTTWRWGVNVASNPALKDSRSMLDDVMIATLEREMESRGYTHAEDGDADFILLYATLTGAQVIAQREVFGYFFIFSTHTAARGLLTVQFLDPETEDPMWVAFAEAMAISEKKAKKKVESVVRKMLDLVGKPDQGTAP